MAESIERRFDIAEGYLCSFERKPGFEERRIRWRRSEGGSLRGSARRSREPGEREGWMKEGARRGLTLTIHPLYGGNAREC